jgi:hypothetical protein
MPEDLRMQESVLEQKRPVEFLVWREGKIIKLSVIPAPHPKDTLLESVKVTGNHPLNGIQIVTLVPELAEKINVPSDTKGVVVLNDLSVPVGIAGFSVFNGGAFIQKGDLITQINGRSLEKAKDLPEVLKATATNKTFSVHLWRKGQEIQFSIDGINMGDQQAAVEQGNKPDDQNVQQQQADMHKQLQNMFKGMALGHSSPKSFLGAEKPSSSDKNASIADSLKSIPSQMA